MDVKQKIIEAINILDELEGYDRGLNDKLSYCDCEICDLMHLIENNTLKTNQCYRVIKELKRLRIERRKIKNDMDLLTTYKTNQQKLLNYDHRKFLISEIGKKEKNLNQQYKNRVYTEEEIKELIGG